MIEIKYPDYKYLLSIAKLQTEMQRLIYAIEATKRNIARVEEELEAIRGDAEEVLRYEKSKQALQDMIDDKAPELCPFCDDNLPIETAINGHGACGPCARAYDDD
jgi:DNA repair exonuclease SbcCD ATPase subunit